MRTKKNFNSYLTLVVSCLLGILSINQLVQACAGVDWYWRDNPQVFMQPDVGALAKRYEPFYYTYDFLNGGKDAGAQTLTEEDVINEDEQTSIWYTQLKQQVSKKVIYRFLYQSRAYIFEETPTLSHFTAFYERDTFVQLIKNQKQVLTYFMVAKANEFSTDELDNGWNEFSSWDAYGEENIPNTNGSYAVTKLIEQKLYAEKNAFYKQRYAFQLIRNYRYTYQSDKVDTLYQTYFANTPNSQLKLAALNYATDALVNANKPIKANYYASILFNASEEKQFRAYHNLSNKIAIEHVLPYCKTSEEKGMVYALYAFKDFFVNAEYVQKAVELDPNNTSIHTLLTRELNKIDYKIMPELSGLFGIGGTYEPAEEQSITDENGEVIRTYPSAENNTLVLRKLLQNLQARKTPHQDFYTLCLAHLSLISYQLDDARVWLNQLNPDKLEPKLALQHHLTSTLLHIKSANLRKPENQDVLARQLLYIDAHQQEIYYNEFIPNGIRTIAVAKLLKDQDYAHAYLLAEQVTTIYDSYALFENQLRPQDIDTILAIRKQPKSIFEKSITVTKSLRDDELYDIQGSLYMRVNNLIMANASFKKSDPTFIPINFAKLNTNPDGHPCYPYMYTPIAKEEEQYYTPENVIAHNERAHRLAWETTHYSVTQTMLNLMQQIKQKKGDMAAHYYNLASLYMEISFYGRAYSVMQFNDSWSWYEIEYPGEYGPYGAHYYGSAWAIPYYELALKYSKNRELTAKCLYALFRCNRHLKRYQNKEESTKDIDYLYKLHDQYANTEYYRIKECWGLSAYVKALRTGEEETSE